MTVMRGERIIVAVLAGKRLAKSGSEGTWSMDHGRGERQAIRLDQPGDRPNDPSK
jgi:hypothetical protein